MKSLVKTEFGFGHFVVQDKSEPSPGKDQIKIEVKYAGICGSDIHAYEGHYKVGVPVTLGHEFSGVVAEVGEGVTDFKVGDRVTSETTFYICGNCRYCKSKDYNLCSLRRGLGTHQDGAFAKYLIARKESVHHLPANVDFRSAALTEPLACTHHAIDKTEINEGDIVVVIGPGPIGLLAAQVAKARGGKVIITGLTNDKVRLDKARELGIDYVMNTQEEDIKDLINKLTDGYGCNVVIECSGAVPAAKQGLDLLQKQGQYVQVGLFTQPDIQFDLEKIIQKEIRVVGSRSQKPADWEPSLALMNEGKVNAKALVTHEFNITQWDEAYHAIKSGEAIKVLLTPVED
ncbi:zinc-binding dehydrogenase [Thermoactinomyces sp. CICC 10521]|jgi:L-iditol 2-dehydrogenase|uniref:zinc-binding dehydrogenase n=1 Tax=Thermoactinomyces sp. CICC 10521 TaxID=2767426 RepID=UPI0018DB97D8|nr:zinc-binding dehydrogenase [Thermoactinomyces sp. CICC 10521]MBH8608833.1 zinc-binding dehydrogenase [Thermoactinomyces sp. CICC 10521]